MQQTRNLVEAFGAADYWYHPIELGFGLASLQASLNQVCQPGAVISKVTLAAELDGDGKPFIRVTAIAHGVAKVG